MDINPSIFKAYDVRGVYPGDLNDEIAYRVGRSFVTYLGADNVVVGLDMRTSSPALHGALVRGITDQGADVIDIGTVSSDMFYFACGSKGLPGITVTASHNPPEYNGFKMVKRMPELLSGGKGMEELRDLVVGGSYGSASRKGTVSKENIRDGYRRKILSIVDSSRIVPRKVVVDAANGMGGVAFDLLYRDLPLDVVRMYFDPDGTFPNHGGDPLLEENRRELQERVVSEGADLGFAFDPDADRCFAIDSRGVFIPGDFMTALLGRYLVEKNGGGAVVYDTRASWAVPDLIRSAGGEPVEMRVGHAFIKPKMEEAKAVFGGEVTGHYYFPDFFFADSGAIPSLILLEMLDACGRSLADLIEPLEQEYFISGEINSTVGDPDATLAAIREMYGRDNHIYEMDGVSIVAGDRTWHANVRKSNTEPLVRLNLEATSRALMEQRQDEVLELIRDRT